MSTESIKHTSLDAGPSFLAHLPKEDKEMKKLNTQITALVKEFILSTPSMLIEFGHSNYSFDLRFNQTKLEIKPIDGEWINPMKIKGLDENQLKQLQRIEKLFANYIKAGLIQDPCINGSIVYMPGVSSLISLPWDLKTSVNDLNEAKKVGDKDGYKEAVHKLTSQIFATFGSLILLADLVQKGVTYFLPHVIPVALSTVFAVVGSIVALIVCAAEMGRELLWMKFSSDAIQDLHVNTIKELKQTANLLENKMHNGEELSVDEYRQVRSVVAHAVTDITKSSSFSDVEKEELERRVKIITQAADMTYRNYGADVAPRLYQNAFNEVHTLREQFIEKDFEVLAEGLESKETLQKRARQFGANFTSQLALHEASIKADFKSTDPRTRKHAYDKGAKFLSEARKQAIKKIVLYSLGILVCILTALMFVIPGFNVMIALFIASLVAFAFTTFLFYEHFVERNGALISPEHDKEQCFQNFWHAYQMGLEAEEVRKKVHKEEDIR